MDTLLYLWIHYLYIITKRIKKLPKQFQQQKHHYEMFLWSFIFFVAKKKD